MDNHELKSTYKATYREQGSQGGLPENAAEMEGEETRKH